MRTFLLVMLLTENSDGIFIDNHYNFFNKPVRRMFTSFSKCKRSVWRKQTLLLWSVNSFLGSDSNTFSNTIYSYIVADPGCARFLRIWTFFMRTQKTWEIRRHRKWSLNRQLQCKSVKINRAQTPQNLALTKVLQISGKRAHPRIFGGGGGGGNSKEWTLSYYVA